MRGQNVAAAVVLERGTKFDAKEDLPFTDSGRIDEKRLAERLAQLEGDS